MNEKEKEALLEQLANAEHERWVAYMKHHLSNGKRQPGHSGLWFPEVYVRGLERLCELPYAKLYPHEQDLDKQVVYEFLSEISVIGERLPPCPFGPDFVEERRRIRERR